MQVFKTTFGERSKNLSISMFYLAESLYFDYWYGYLLYILEIAIFIYKGSKWFYSNFAGEIIFVIILMVAHFIRTWLGKSGNRGQSNWRLIVFLILCLGEIAGAIFFLRFQSYTYYLEIGIFALGAIFIAFGFILGLANIIVFNV